MARAVSVFTASRKSRVDGLRALRDRLSRQIDDPDLASKDLAPLSSRHMAVMAEIAELEAAAAAETVEARPASGRDEIAARRAARLAARKAS